LQFTHIVNRLEKGNRDKHHTYTFGGEKYPGITTVLKKSVSQHDKSGLERWMKSEPHSEYIMKFAGMIGVQTHKLIEDYLNNKLLPVNKSHLLAYAHFERLQQEFLHKINNVNGIEIYLYSKKLKIAGTSDCVAEYDGKLSIIDYKTKRSDQLESYLNGPFLQSTAYAIMWEEMTGIPINQIVILVSSEQGQLKEFIKNPNDYKEELYNRIKNYYLQ